MAENWVQLMVTHDPVEASTVKALLENEGLEVRAETAHDRPFPVDAARKAEVRLMVRAGDLSRARNAVEQYLEEMEE